MALKKSQKSLKKWSKQKWRTKSGKKSSETGERYLPTKAIKALSSKEYAATTKKKREDTKKGKQHSKQPKKIASCRKSTERATRRFAFPGFFSAGPLSFTAASEVRTRLRHPPLAAHALTSRS